MGEITLMNRFTLLDKMREHYKNRDIGALKRGLSLGAFFLLEEDKVKIRKAIYKLEEEIGEITENEKMLINKARKELL